MVDKMAQWLQQLRNRLYSGNQYRQLVDSVEVDPTPGISSRWIVSRHLCSFFSIDFEHIEKPLRQAALENQVEILTPYKTPGFWVAWHGATAKLWVWDRQALNEGMAAHLLAGDNAATIDVLPESAFCERRENAIVLLRAMDGYVGQAWRDGALVDEAFWRDLPDESRWARFVRGAGGDDWSKPEATGRLLAGEHPWKTTWSGQAEQRQLELLGVVSGLVLFVGLSVYQLVAWGVMTLAISQADTRIESLRESTREVLAVRDETFRLHDLNRKLAVTDPVRQLTLMEAILQALPEDAGSITNWDFHDDTLEFILENPSPDLGVYAAALDPLEQVDGVRLEPRDRQNRLLISVRVNL